MRISDRTSTVGFLIALLLTSVASAADDYCYIRGQQVPLGRTDRRVIVTRRRGGWRRIQVLERGGAVAAADRADVVFEAPVRTLAGQDFAVTDEILVRTRPEADADALRALVAPYGLEQTQSPRKGIVVLRLPRGADLDPITVSNRLHESPLTVWAHPNYVAEMDPLATVTDPLYPSQWHLKNTGQSGAKPGADVKAETAWDTTFGSASIVIAVLDDGVEILHEDLASQIVGGYDFADNDTDPTGGAHGTSVAGVAAAAANNGGGVTGVAPGCRMLGARWGSTVLASANMFYWARDNGAHVITNSWAFTTRVCPDIVKEAILDVATNGRGGKGCVVLFAAGNESEEIRPLSCAALPHVIPVGASSARDTRSGYSNYGRMLSILAPSNGNGPGIVTTDRTGSAGYSAGNYTYGFGGTSSATPLAAGVTGLILSANPNLTASQVKGILEHTADKIDAGVADYDPTTGHSFRYGHGRVNAAAALAAVTGGETWPRPVTNLRIAEGDSQLALAWDNPDEDCDGVLIVSSTAPITWTPTDGVVYTLGQTPATDVTVESADVRDAFVHTPLANGVGRTYALFVRNTTNYYSHGAIGSGVPLLELDRVVFVDASATGANTGGSWPDAFVTLADGVVAANASSIRKNVWVAAGAYGGGQQLGGGVSLYGGFAGGETTLSQRNWRTNATTIDAAGANYGVQVADGCLIDGFTIRGAVASDVGGGVHVPSRVEARIANCRITDNRAARGGGVNASVQSRPTLVNCVLDSNTATTSGGAIRAYQASPIFIHCTSVGNTGGTEGGGGAFLYQSVPIFINSIFWANTPANIDIVATPSGGGVLTAADTDAIDYSVRLSRIGHCLVGGGLGGVTYADNILDADPQLSQIYRLSSASPCVDAGTSGEAGAIWALPAEDIDADPRILQSGPDLGADEIDTSLPYITLDADSLSFTGRPPAPQTLTVGNPGGSTLNWTATSHPPAWLLLDGAAGAAGATPVGGTTPLSVAVDTSAMVYGDYETTLTLTAPGAPNSPVSIPVSLHVTASTEPAIEFSPATIAAVISSGQSSVSAPLEIWNAGPDVLHWTASPAAPWLQAIPAAGDSAGERDTVALVFNATGLTPGTYDTVLTIADPGAENSPRDVPVQLVVEGAELIVDNSDPGYSVVSGTWATWTGSGNYYGPDCRYHSAGAGSNRCRWSADLPVAGTWEV
ncbi:S8 family serine peptidase, partial [bacterium]|nr:S8 family serine peptidase [bacterium]